MISDWLHSLGLSFQYFTRLPLPFSFRYNDITVKRTIFFFPLIGWVIGLLANILFRLLDQNLPSSLTAVLLIAFLLWITGGLHADGWMDVSDGIGSSRGKERMLEIMKDSRVGAMGVIAFFVLYSLKLTSLYELIKTEELFAFFIATPIIARWGVVLAVYAFPYAREKGMGKEFKEWLKTKYLLLSLLWIVPVFVINFHLFWIFLISILFTIVSGIYFTKKLGGLTGDMYGWLIEGNEAVIWVFLLLIAGWL